MAKPKLALIPSAQGSKLYSVLPSSGVGDFDFSRSGGATRINKDGLIETVASGVSRLNYPLIDGKVVGCPSHLLEPSRLQKIQYSEDFSQGYWGKSNVTVTTNQTISPDGSQNADKFLENTSTASHLISKSGISITSGVSHTLSVFVKANGRNTFRLFADTGGNSSFAYFNLETKSIGSKQGLTASKIEEYPNDWYRCSISFTPTTTSIYVQFLLTLDNETTSYTGDGSSGMYLWGAMLEQGSFPTSYIPTTNSAVTRSAETANNSGDASTFNDSEGVLMAEISALDNDITNRIISISDGSGSNRVLVKFDNSSNLIQGTCTVGTDQASLLYYTNDITINSKVLFLYKSNDFQLWVDGFKRDFDSNGTTPSGLDRLNFDNSSGGSNFYGNTKQIQYFDSALNDSDLEKLTSWVSFYRYGRGSTLFHRVVMNNTKKYKI